MAERYYIKPFESTAKSSIAAYKYITDQAVTKGILSNNQNSIPYYIYLAQPEGGCMFNLLSEHIGNINWNDGISTTEIISKRLYKGNKFTISNLYEYNFENSRL
jgi:hypothetical protein